MKVFRIAQQLLGLAAHTRSTQAELAMRGRRLIDIPSVLMHQLSIRLSRRLCVGLLLLAGATFDFGLTPSSATEKPLYRVLFSNDTTNIVGCVSPYHVEGDELEDDMIRSSVDETIGADVHMLQPGLGWIPWWKSKAYSAIEHYKWWSEKSGMEPHEYGKYMLSGGDMVEVFVDECHKKGQTPFVSLRLNDGHCLEFVGIYSDPTSVWVPRFYEQHPEYRLGSDRRDWDEHVQNWMIPEVREYKFEFIRELCENYDLAGLELDFMRHVCLFPLDSSTSHERAEIITTFVGRVRKLLDAAAKPGCRRWLCVRIPAQIEAFDALGINLPELVSAGVDMINLSGYYYTQQQTDLPKICLMTPETAVYLEMTHCTTTGRTVGKPDRSRTYDDFTFRRTTDHQFYTGAHLAYSRGASGVSLFNFAYYREHGARGRGPFNEPPFHVLRHLGDPDWLARQSQWYVIAQVRNQPELAKRPMPLKFREGQNQVLKLDMAPTKHQKQDGILRLMTKDSCAGYRWIVKVNSVVLSETDFVRKPIEHPYEAGLGDPNQYACFTLPRDSVKNGLNEIAIELDEGAPSRVEYIDLVLP